MTWPTQLRVQAVKGTRQVALSEGILGSRMDLYALCQAMMVPPQGAEAMTLD